MSYGYLRGRGVVREELYVLLLVAILGCAFLVASTHFASFFLGLEVLSVSLYALVAYHRAHPTDIEAGIKYLIPARPAFLLFAWRLVCSAPTPYNCRGWPGWSRQVRGDPSSPRLVWE
jgi:NADH-quinone oxidoreductase subunit N